MSETLKLKCHCGGVHIEITAPNGLEKIRRCNCSMCARRSAVVASAKLKDLNIVAGDDLLSIYQFNTKTAKHYFCSRCGIYTHHQRRSDPTEFGFNVACVDGVKIEDYAHVPFLDGRDNHPADQS